MKNGALQTNSTSAQENFLTIKANLFGDLRLTIIDEQQVELSFGYSYLRTNSYEPYLHPLSRNENNI